MSSLCCVVSLLQYVMLGLLSTSRKGLLFDTINQTEITEITIYPILPEVFFMVGKALKKLM